MKQQVMVRHGATDYDALTIASGMEAAGADVFSVVYTGDRGYMSYVIFAKFSPPVTLDEIDDAIEKKLTGEDLRDEFEAITGDANTAAGLRAYIGQAVEKLDAEWDRRRGAA